MANKFYAVVQDNCITITQSKAELEAAIKDFPKPVFYTCNSYQEAMQKLNTGLRKRFDQITALANTL